MSLHKIGDFDSNYREYFQGLDIVGFDLYSGNDKVGSVDDILVDDEGSFRYYVISTGFWGFGKKTLLPIGRARIDATNHRVYADGLTKEQVESLPEFDANGKFDYDREEQTRQAYRSPATADMTATAPSMPASPVPNRDTYDYKQDSDLYDLNHNDRQILKLYEERLIASKNRQKTGEVSIGKHVETEEATVSVPVEKERIVIERTPVNTQVVEPSEANFQSGEVARMEVYEETADIHKEAFVREEVSIRKEVDRETVQGQEQLRREELDIEKEGRTIVEQGTESHPDAKTI